MNHLSLRHAYRVSFVSVHDNLDLSTPSGHLMFQVVGAMAEFERALTQERVRAGLRLAKSKGKRLGRPYAGVNPEQVATLRAGGTSWKVISRELGIGVGTIPGRRGNESPGALAWPRRSRRMSLPGHLDRCRATCRISPWKAEQNSLNPLNERSNCGEFKCKPRSSGQAPRDLARYWNAQKRQCENPIHFLVGPVAQV